MLKFKPWSIILTSIIALTLTACGSDSKPDAAPVATRVELSHEGGLLAIDVDADVAKQQDAFELRQFDADGNVIEVLNGAGKVVEDILPVFSENIEFEVLSSAESTDPDYQEMMDWAEDIDFKNGKIDISVFLSRLTDEDGFPNKPFILKATYTRDTKKFSNNFQFTLVNPVKTLKLDVTDKTYQTHEGVDANGEAITIYNLKMGEEIAISLQGENGASSKTLPVENVAWKLEDKDDGNYVTVHNSTANNTLTITAANLTDTHQVTVIATYRGVSVPFYIQTRATSWVKGLTSVKFLDAVNVDNLDLEVEQGKTLNIKIEATVTDASGKQSTEVVRGATNWLSKNPDVASVSSSTGEISAKSWDVDSGKVEISVEIGDKTETFFVQVRPKGYIKNLVEDSVSFVDANDLTNLSLDIIDGQTLEISVNADIKGLNGTVTSLKDAQAFDWTSSNKDVVTVNSSTGVITAQSAIVDDGKATITTLINGIAYSFEVQVRPKGYVKNIESISIVNPLGQSDNVQVLQGGSLVLDVLAVITDDTKTYTQKLSNVKWSSLNTNIATVDEKSGQVIGLNSTLNNGNVEIQAIVAGKTTSLFIQVTTEIIPDKLVKLEIELVDETLKDVIVAKNQSLALKAIGYFANGTNKEISANWISDDNAIATVAKDTGLVTGVSAVPKNTVKITASLNGVNAFINVTVTETACDQTINVSNISPLSNVVQTKTTVDYKLKGTKNGRVVDIENVIWSVDADSTIAELSPAGTFFSKSTETEDGKNITVTAKYCGDDYTTTVRIKDVVNTEMTAIVVSPTSRELIVGEQYTFDIKARFKDLDGLFDMTIADAEQVAWSSSNSDIISVGTGQNDKGLITALKESDEVVIITATFGELVATARARVSSRVLENLTVEVSRTKIAVDQPVLVQAFAHYNNGDKQDVSYLADWSIDRGNDIDVNNSTSKGLVTGLEVGGGTVIVEYQDLRESIDFDVVKRDFVTIHYQRSDEDYSNRGMHIWNKDNNVLTVDPSELTTWEQQASLFEGEDAFGAFRDVKLDEADGTLCFLVMKDNSGNWDKSDDMLNTDNHCFNPSEQGFDVWVKRKDNRLVFTDPTTSVTANVAYWLDEDTIAVKVSEQFEGSFKLNYKVIDADYSLELSDNQITDGKVLNLSWNNARIDGSDYPTYKHTDGFAMLTLPKSLNDSISTMLKGPLFVLIYDLNGNLISRQQLQTAMVIDDHYSARTAELGTIYNGTASAPSSTSLWAPTAQSVKLKVFDDNLDLISEYETEIDGNSGVWSFDKDLDNVWTNTFYQYEVAVYSATAGKVIVSDVTDPYSTGLSANGVYSQFVNPESSETEPSNWAALTLPHAGKNAVDYVLYELHVRDFSIYDETNDAKGKFSAFSDTDSDAMQHLLNIANNDDKGGITHVQLMPIYDFAGVNESTPHTVYSDTSSLGNSTQPRNALNANTDGYDWGYNSAHFMVPEGSYSSDANDSKLRIKELREMVQALAVNGMRVSMDMAFNRMALDSNAVAELDKIVPGYYLRLDGDGNYQQYSCSSNESCADTATEHDMMAKLVADSAKYWATEFAISAIRLEQMSLLSKDVVKDIKDELRDQYNDDAFIYGESWDIGGLVQRNSDVAATAENMDALNISTFNGMLRDAARGGSPIDPITTQGQGFITGEWSVPHTTDSGVDRGKLIDLMSKIRAGLAGNVTSFVTTDNNGNQITGRDIGAKNTGDVANNIAYITSHDHHTLWDQIAAKGPKADVDSNPDDGEADFAMRKRMQWMGISAVALAQGVPFYQAGTELLRSKSGDANSGNSGEWFNRLEFNSIDYATLGTNFGVGLPPIASNSNTELSMWSPLLSNSQKQGRGEGDSIAATTAHFKNMLSIRNDLGILRLEDRSSIKDDFESYGFIGHHKFVEQNDDSNLGAGVIVLRTYDANLSDADKAKSKEQNAAYDKAIVIMNMRRGSVEFEWKETLKLHPSMVYNKDGGSGQSYDAKLADAKWENEKVTVPALSTVVFVRERK